ncbi:MAG: AIR synthase related protein, partial [Nodosilinea sp.]
MASPETVAALGELGLLARLFPYCPAQVVGDDGAVLDLPTGHRLVVTTDVLVEGVHFSDTTLCPQDLGWRAAAANLSDLAAMGSTSVVGLTVGLVAPGETSWSWVEGVYQGLSE